MRGVVRAVPTVITGPTQPAMTPEYAKAHIKAISDAEDELVEMWVLAATTLFEEQTDRTVMTTVRELWLDGFPDLVSGGDVGRIELPFPPLQSVTRVYYADDAGTETDYEDATVSPAEPRYRVSAPAGPYAAPGWIDTLSGDDWPSTQVRSGAVKVRYVAGYGDAPGDVPPLVIGAICYMVGQFDRYREAVHDGSLIEVPGVRDIIRGFKYSAKSSTVHRRIVPGWPNTSVAV